MSFKMNLCAAATVLCALASSAQAGVSYDKSFSTGNSDFGVSAKVAGNAGFASSAGQVHFGGTGEFRGTLFGLSKKAVLAAGGWNNPSTTKLDMSLSIDGITLASKTQYFNTTQGSFVLPSFSFFSASKQFTVWGVPVVVMVDVDSVAEGQYVNLILPANFSGISQTMKSIWTLNGSIGATGTLTMGPGTSLIGAGVYGTTTLGKTKAAVNRSKVLSTGTSWKFEMRGDLYYGGIEIGVTAWIGGAQVSATVFRIDEATENLVKINF